MTEQEQTILNRITGFGVYKVEVTDGVRRDLWKGLEIKVSTDNADEPLDFFFPDYAHMSDVEIAEVIANNLREELWNSLRPQN